MCATLLSFLGSMRMDSVLDVLYFHEFTGVLFPSFLTLWMRVTMVNLRPEPFVGRYLKDRDPIWEVSIFRLAGCTMRAISSTLWKTVKID